MVPRTVKGEDEIRGEAVDSALWWVRFALLQGTRFFFGFWFWFLGLGGFSS
jgi:hypothetical protein